MPYSHPTTDPKTVAGVCSALEQLEAVQQVEIVLAVESGSRAWGFPSPDSDYDARFLFLGEPVAVTASNKRKGVIQTPMSQVGDAYFDLAGWSVPKAISLATRSNAVLLEWLSSPLSYRSNDVVRNKLMDFARRAVNLDALAYHYYGTVRQIYSPIMDGQARPKLKAYCYCLRSAFAMRWIIEHQEPPPMDMPSLMEGLRLSEGMRSDIQELIENKRAAVEKESSQPVGWLDVMLRKVLHDRRVRQIWNSTQEIEAEGEDLAKEVEMSRAQNHLSPAS